MASSTSKVTVISLLPLSLNKFPALESFTFYLDMKMWPLATTNYEHKSEDNVSRGLKFSRTDSFTKPGRVPALWSISLLTKQLEPKASSA